MKLNVKNLLAQELRNKYGKQYRPYILDAAIYKLLSDIGEINFKDNISVDLQLNWLMEDLELHFLETCKEVIETILEEDTIKLIQ